MWQREAAYYQRVFSSNPYAMKKSKDPQSFSSMLEPGV